MTFDRPLLLTFFSMQYAIPLQRVPQHAGVKPEIPQANCSRGAVDTR
ncbi:MAG: hypothetical protein H0W13_07935 [Nitrospirales bacterium]|nr:hypothetical protein [Nitrospirales bacterium]